MTDDSHAAVADLPTVEVPPTPSQRRRRQPADARPKPQPPYAVVLFNDDEHSFEYVGDPLGDVLNHRRIGQRAGPTC